MAVDFLFFTGNVVSSELSNLKKKKRIVVRLALKYCSEKRMEKKNFYNRNFFKMEKNRVLLHSIFTFNFSANMEALIFNFPEFILEFLENFNY